MDKEPSAAGGNSEVRTGVTEGSSGGSGGRMKPKQPSSPQEKSLVKILEPSTDDDDDDDDELDLDDSGESIKNLIPRSISRELWFTLERLHIYKMSKSKLSSTGKLCGLVIKNFCLEVVELVQILPPAHSLQRLLHCSDYGERVHL